MHAAGSEFVLACDMRFASRENAVGGQFEVALGVVPGGAPMARLARLARRGRAPETLPVADDHDGPAAELFDYVNRAIADDQLDRETATMAERLARFDHEAITRTKAHVDRATLPPDSELALAAADFRELFARPPSRHGGRGSRSSDSTPTATSNGRSVAASSTRSKRTSSETACSRPPHTPEEA